MESDPLTRLKAKLRARELVLGMQHSSGSAAVLELLGRCGFDFVILDMEHTAYSIALVEDLVRAAEAVGLVALVRVLHGDAHLIMQALDTGAQGVLVPHIRTRAECEAVVAAKRFQPLGVRGKTSASRAAGWGTREWSEYEQWANEETLVVPIIEDREAVGALEEILSVPGLELVAVGPGDLSQSYGEPEQGLRARPVMEALERTIAYCEPRGIGVMTIPAPDMSAELVRELVQKGARVIWYGGDLNHMGEHFRRLAAKLL